MPGARGDSQGGSRQHAGQHGPGDVPARDITGSRACLSGGGSCCRHDHRAFPVILNKPLTIRIVFEDNASVVPTQGNVVNRAFAFYT